MLIGLLSLLAVAGRAQDRLTQARQQAERKEWALAKTLYSKLYDETPLDADVYTEYLNTLLQLKDYKAAEQLVGNQLQLRGGAPMQLIDLGWVYEVQGKDKKAEEQYNQAIQYVNGDDLLTQQIAAAFSAKGKDALAIQTYERARRILQNAYLYSGPLSRLYFKTGDIEKAVTALLDAAPGQMGGVEDTKATLLEFLGNDPKKLQQTQKTLIKRINQQPDNVYYAELLTWLYTQRDDWDGALLQIQAIDERNKEDGRRLIDFAMMAAREKQYDIAVRSLNAVREQGKEKPFYAMALAEQLRIRTLRLKETPVPPKEEIQQLLKDYDLFFTDNPSYYAREMARDYAMVQAQYAGAPTKGIATLQKALDHPDANRAFAAQCKLQMGDYQVLNGKVWEASLLYSQVDKAFREDMLGEEARFRNAKLAYYRGDFSWAQGQLSVLKASTSELIANDALYLSVLITENITPDSNLLPLQRFAYADLLLFQNRDQEAAQLLDSLNQHFPEHPLQDDILMLDAKLAQKHGEYDKALSYLKTIYEKYGKDVLGDDAVFKTAELYETFLKQPANARKFYEQLIVDYPGSTYVQTARQRLSQLSQSTDTPVAP